MAGPMDALGDVTRALTNAGLISAWWPVGARARGLPGPAEALVVPTIYTGVMQPLPGLEALRLRAQEETFNLYLRTLEKWLAAKLIGRAGVWRADGKARAFTWDGHPVTLHACLPGQQPGLLRVLLTGPEKFAAKFRAPRARGGYLPEGHQVGDGRYYVGGVEEPVPDEQALFALVGLPYVEPWRRT